MYHVPACSVGPVYGEHEELKACFETCKQGKTNKDVCTYDALVKTCAFSWTLGA